MLFRPFYLSCLAHASYLIADGGEAVVIDPQRDVDQYLDEAAQLGVKIKYIVETHLHADFVSGHRELAARTGGTIVFGARAEAEVPHLPVHDGDVLRVGAIELRAIETPGHTPEGITWLVTENGKPSKLLTGDTLFIGDVGRPDLAGSRGFTSEEMAGMLYDSLHGKLLTLPDDVEVWPAHGAGSACGKNMSNERSSTLGIQRRTNYALRPMPREEFVRMLTSDLSAPPPYFPRDMEMNRRGARPLSEVTAEPMTPAAICEAIEQGALVLDVRSAGDFGARHIDGAINIGLAGQFASWAGTLLAHDARLIVFAVDEAKAAEAVMRLARVGIEGVIGYTTSFDDFPSATTDQTIVQIDVQDLAAASRPVLDVRRTAEYEAGHVPGARNLPLDELPQRLEEVPRDGNLAVICAGGYRSSMACSLLARAGFANVVNVTGGTGAWVREGLPMEW
jgi:glyoxylase-like metal-dependent hydrolase (beta-lactamase superfamily II)/rhodanese-related sulfurtransferase